MLWSLLLISLIGMQQAHAVCWNEKYKIQPGITSQSSDNNDSKSERAIDGNEKTCAHTQTQQGPWWRIDLQDIYDISCVILNSIYGPSSDIGRAQIFIGNSLKNNGTTNPKYREINNFVKNKKNEFRGQVSGRYVTVFIPGQGELVLCEVEVYGKPKACWNEQNKIQTGITSQSSDNTNGDHSKKAIDEKLDTCAHTQTQQDPWWRIDLQDIYDISCVGVYNKRGPSSDMRNVQIFIGNSLENNGTANRKCNEINNFKTDEVNVFRCAGQVSGRYVTVFRPGQKELVLCEVRIFGEPKACWNEQSKIQPGITSQSSDNTNGDHSKKAIDEKLDTCAHTQTQQDPWWRIDLQDIYNISCVGVYNKRGPPPSSDMSHVQIFIGNSLEKNGTTNRKCNEINNFKTDEVNIFRCDGQVSGRYVTVFRPGQKELVLCEVRIFGEPKVCGSYENRIQTGITSQSSNNTNGDHSKKAFDGKWDTCAHTQTQQGPWWRIDLQDIYDISCVGVYNKRGPSSSSDMSHVQIFIGNSLEKNGTTNPKCKEIKDFKTDKWNILRCAGKVSGRYVTVFVPEQTELVLCEVRIHGKPKVSPFVLIQENKTWEDALDYCRSRNMDLASILDDEDQEFAALKARSATTPFVWLGLHYTCILEAWFWVADHRLEFSRWAPGGKVNECDVSGAMEKSGQHQWSSKFDSNEFNFICERCV